jgi:hypothetical protein
MQSNSACAEPQPRRAVIAARPHRVQLFAQAKTNGGRGLAFCSVGRAAARAEDRYQGLARIAAHRAVGLHGANIGARIAFVPLIALVAGLSLRALRPLRAGWPLGSRHTLNALCTLGSGRTLGARVALRARIATARRETDGNAHGKQR